MPNFTPRAGVGEDDDDEEAISYDSMLLESDLLVVRLITTIFAPINTYMQAFYCKSCSSSFGFDNVAHLNCSAQWLLELASCQRSR
jgi:hypothetical protein